MKIFGLWWNLWHAVKRYKIKSQQLINWVWKAADKLISDLPLGWRQKLAFLVALIHDPEIVFLDEPTSGVDPITRRQFWSLIYEAAYKGVTIFLTTHYMDESEYCDRVSIMVDGRIAALDKPQQLKKTFAADSMNEVFIRLVEIKNLKNRIIIKHLSDFLKEFYHIFRDKRHWVSYSECRSL